MKVNKNRMRMKLSCKLKKKMKNQVKSFSTQQLELIKWRVGWQFKCIKSNCEN